ncbi:MAG: dihydropteroate synthase [Verrucomicrobiales bacterium]|nr:dihydropteroate synthase [Verrucomicrobiales bacterium]
MPMRLRACRFEFQFPRSPLIMGILNVTPDSFSDGGQFLDAQAAVAQGLRMVEEGADMIDIGGESTRPGAAPVTEAEELARVLPVIRSLAGRVTIPISIDTVKPGVAEAALDAGAVVVNDVAARRDDEALWRIAARFGAGYVAMHMQGDPATMQGSPHYESVVNEVDQFFGERLDRLGACGLSRDQVILDPGIGFGKTVEHNLQLLVGVKRFAGWQRPLLLGVSRKSFIGKLTGAADPTHRLPGSLAGAVWGYLEGVQLFRVHDVAATRQALRMAEAIRAAGTVS